MFIAAAYIIIIIINNYTDEIIFLSLFVKELNLIITSILKRSKYYIILDHSINGSKFDVTLSKY